MQPYISKPSYDKHPDRMCLTARLFGVNAPLLGSSNNHHDSNQGGQHRVTILELGCGTGSDLIPMALGLPQCEFIGIDASKDMIQTASTTASRLGLQNIRFLQEDITKLSMSLALASQKFDYIIAHGVLSWVDKHTRECILKFCADNLADNGVCYISCNMLPGCEIRDFLRQEFKKIDNVKDTPTKRVLRLREFLSEFAHSDKKQEHLPFQLSRLSTEAKNILALSDEYLLYDVLSESTAFFFQDLAHLVTSSGLRYLGDSKLKRVGFLKGIDLGDNSQNTTETFGDESVTCSEQEADLSRLEMFRANLFGKNSANIVRKPDLSVIENCFLSTVLTYNEDNFGETFFFSPNGKRVEIKSAVVRDMIKALSQSWPQPVHYTALTTTRDVKQDSTPSLNETLELFELFKSELVDLYLTNPFPTSTTTHTTPHTIPAPAISPYARLQLETQNWATNYRHEYICFTEQEMSVAKLLDGTNSVQDICDKLEATVSPDNIEDILLFLHESAFLQ